MGMHYTYKQIDFSNRLDFSILTGRVFKRIVVDRENGDDTIDFYTDALHFVMGHDQSCCENVYIKDIVGDVEDLLHTPIRSAECVVEYEQRDLDGRTSETSVWYKLATDKGSVTITWYGSSNGYYSERAYLYLVKQED